MNKKKERRFNFTVILIIGFLLAIGFLFIALRPQTTDSITSPTGFAVLEDYDNETDCVAEGYTWENITNESCMTETFNITTLGWINSSGYTLTGSENASNFAIIEAWNVTDPSSPILIDSGDYSLNSSTDVVVNATAVNYPNVQFNYTYENETCIEVVTGGNCMGDICGDGIVQTPNDDGVEEVCDDGENNGEYSYCQSDCLAMGPYCGDNITNGNEECDDGDDNGVELGWSEDGIEYCNEDCKLIMGSYCGDGDCDSEENCNNCSSDCGCDSDEICEDGSCIKEDNDEEEISDSSTTSTDSSSTSSITTSATQNETCTPNWECTEWSECVNESQSRTCEDTNNCGTEEGKPSLVQSCEMPETCFDGIQNQDEKGIDCGGVCEQKCSVFTIIGNTVETPINLLKEKVFINKTRTILLIVGLVVIVGGFVALEIFHKKRKNSSGAKNNKKEKSEDEKDSDELLEESREED